MALNIAGTVLQGTASNALSVSNAGTNWLGIDSIGRVRKTQLPAYEGVFSGQGTLYQAAAAKPAQINLNQGGCYSASTGIFTCPVAGRYMIGCNVLCAGVLQGAAANGYFGIAKNGGLLFFTHWNIQTYWEYGGIAGIVECNAGDQLTWPIAVAPAPVAVANAYVYGGGGGGHCSFYCALIG